VTPPPALTGQQKGRPGGGLFYLFFIADNDHSTLGNGQKTSETGAQSA
jgi:hypothetical protein